MNAEDFRHFSGCIPAEFLTERELFAEGTQFGLRLKRCEICAIRGKDIPLKRYREFFLTLISQTKTPSTYEKIDSLLPVIVPGDRTRAKFSRHDKVVDENGNYGPGHESKNGGRNEEDE